MLKQSEQQHAFETDRIHIHTHTHRDTITGESCAAAERMLLAIVLFALGMSFVHALVEGESGCMCVGGRECIWVWPLCLFI